MPSAEVVKRALEQIKKRPANHDYFFSKLTSAEWIVPLDQAGLFSSPPLVVRDGDTISFPPWPESQYLARVASDAPEQVAAVMMKIPETDNNRVHEDLALAATRLPANLAANWAKKEAAWVNAQSYLYLLLPEAFGKLIEYLTIADRTHDSLMLARAVLSLHFDGDTTSRHASAKFDVWKYEHILQNNFSVVIQRTGCLGLALLCDLLERSLFDGPNDQKDFSSIWRPAIEPHEQNRFHGDFRDVLIDAIRGGSESFLLDIDTFNSVIQELLKRKPLVFKRIAMHLLATNPAHPTARELAIDRKVFFDVDSRHEYYRLLTAVFPALCNEERNMVFGWIDEGPPCYNDEDVEDEHLQQKHKAYWQVQRLHGLRGHLPPYWESKYAEIVKEIGEPEHPDFVSYMTTFTGPTSPKELGELEAMTATEIASFLKCWVHVNEWNTPAPEGLGRVLQSVVAGSPDRFVAELGAFRDIDPTYARALVQGLNEAAKTKLHIDWTFVLEYLEWIVAQPRDDVREFSGRLSVDPHWGWARKEVVSLLSTGFEKNTIDFALRERLWKVLETISSDPDPTAEDDEKSAMDPLMRSINTIRGEAMHAVVRYALWVHRRLVGEDRMHQRCTFDISSIPEVGECLEQHLDPSFDPSTAVRAVYGQWFPWLLMLDREWTELRIDVIFPSENAVLRDAAWHTYLASCPVYNDSFHVLRRLYASSVGTLKSEGDSNTGWLGRPGKRLGEHLMVMLGRGVLDWNSDDLLVQRFFENSSVEDASHAIDSIGVSLYNASNPIPEEVVDRFRALWDNLVGYVSTGPSERKQVLKPFGWWFCSGLFETSWAFTQLRLSIDTVGWIEPDFLVIEKLAESAEDHPAESVEVLRALSILDKGGWKLLGSENKIRAVLVAALKTESTRATTMSLIHALGARGHFRFRDLVSD